MLLQASTNAAIIAHILLGLYHAALLLVIYFFAPSETWWILSLVAWVMASKPLLVLIGLSDFEETDTQKPYIYASNPTLEINTNLLSHFFCIVSCIASVIASICLYVYYN